MISGFILLVFPVVAVLSAIIYLPYYIYVRKKYGKKTVVFHLSKYALIGCVLSLVYLTLLWYYPYITFHPENYFLNVIPFVWVKESYTMGMQKMLEQLVLNIAMFIPYGLLLPLAIKKMRSFYKTAIVVFLSTFMIEFLQYFMGRSADIDDIIMNFIGGITGYFLFWLFRKKVK
jgi:glycopeptide antibiotics resistance protein